MSSAGAAAAIAVAAAKRKARHRKEEEIMTKYSSEDLDGWEFKIVRASTRRFKNREQVKQLCDEEAKAGWEMVEKFDDYRIRFKRRVEHRSRDQYLDIDPYRSEIGTTQAGIVVAVLIAIAILTAGVVILTARMGQH